MNLDFFKETRLLDGGMGQELLARGMVSLGDLWSASAVLDKNQHQLVVDTHLDFAKAGADVIVTNSFTTRRLRLRSNNQESHFEDANRAAGKIAQRVKQSYPKIKMKPFPAPPTPLSSELDISCRHESYSYRF